MSEHFPHSCAAAIVVHVVVQLEVSEHGGAEIHGDQGKRQLACSTFTCGGAMLLFQSPEEAKEGIFLPFLGLTLLVEGEDGGRGFVPTPHGTHFHASQVVEGLYLLSWG